MQINIAKVPYTAKGLTIIVMRIMNTVICRLTLHITIQMSKVFSFVFHRKHHITGWGVATDFYILSELYPHIKSLISNRWRLSQLCELSGVESTCFMSLCISPWWRSDWFLSVTANGSCHLKCPRLPQPYSWHTLSPSVLSFFVVHSIYNYCRGLVFF